MLPRKAEDSPAFTVQPQRFSTTHPALQTEVALAPSGDKSVIVQITPQLSAICVLAYTNQAYGYLLCKDILCNTAHIYTHICISYRYTYIKDSLVVLSQKIN